MEIKSALQERRRELFLTSTVGIFLLGLILLFLNGLGSWFFVRLDMTRSHAYSLSNSSRELVRNLEDPVVIKAYFTSDLPSPYNAYARYVKDLLLEYRSASRGRVRFEFVPSIPLQAFEQKADEAGMMPVQFQEMGSDQFKIRRGYMGLVFYYRDKVEPLPVVRNPEQLEYDITSRLAKMTRKNKKILAITTGHSEQDWRTSSSKLAKDLADLYDIHEVALPPTTTDFIKADILFIAGPQVRLDDASLWVIDQMIMQGTPAVFCVDAKHLMLPQFIAAPHVLGLDELLKTYGVQVGKNLIYDAQCESVNMTQNLNGVAFTSSVQYPYLPSVTHFEKDLPALRGLEVVAMPFSTRIDPVLPLPAGVRFTPLLSSSPQSWVAKEEAYSLAPTAIPTPTPDEPHGPFVLAALAEGTFPSHFAGKPVPTLSNKKLKLPPTILSSPATSIAVLGTAQMLNPQIPGTPGGDALLMNLMAYLTKEETLIGIREKGEIVRPLKPVTPGTREGVKWGSIFGAPLLVVLWGLWRWRRRNVWRGMIATAFHS